MFIITIIICLLQCVDPTSVSRLLHANAVSRLLNANGASELLSI